MSRYVVTNERLDGELTLSQTVSGLVAWLLMLWYGVRVDVQKGTRYYVCDPVGQSAERLIDHLITKR